METTQVQENKVQEQNQQETKQEQVKAAEVPQEDLITRASKVAIKTDEQPPHQEEHFDIKDIDKIKDPEAKAYAEQAYKSFEKGYQKKFQDLAAERKKAEELAGKYSKWTPEKVQELINDQDFIQAAQAVTQSSQNQSGGQMSDEEWSALTDTEKKEFRRMQSNINSLMQQNQMMALRQQDESNRARYANYEPGKIDELAHKIQTGQYQATREDAWKVIDYEPAIRRAYELGLQDKNSEIGKKINFNSAEGGNINAGEEPPKKNEGESGTAYFKRIAAWRMASSKQY